MSEVIATMIYWKNYSNVHSYQN